MTYALRLVDKQYNYGKNEQYMNTGRKYVTEIWVAS